MIRAQSSLKRAERRAANSAGNAIFGDGRETFERQQNITAANLVHPLGKGSLAEQPAADDIQRR